MKTESTKSIRVKGEEDFERYKLKKQLEIVENMPRIQEDYIRHLFNCSIFDAHKQGCIEAAKTWQMDELVEELEHALYTERFISEID